MGRNFCEKEAESGTKAGVLSEMRYRAKPLSPIAELEKRHHGRNQNGKPDAYDNALAETINGLYKTEVIRRRGPWRNIEAVEFATLAWVHWFNTKRLLEPIGWTSPAEYEKAYYRDHAMTEMAA
jgi:transposase InsO family protein